MKSRVRVVLNNLPSIRITVLLMRAHVLLYGIYENDSSLWEKINRRRVKCTKKRKGSRSCWSSHKLCYDGRTKNFNWSPGTETLIPFDLHTGHWFSHKILYESYTYVIYPLWRYIGFPSVFLSHRCCTQLALLWYKYCKLEMHTSFSREHSSHTT